MQPPPLPEAARARRTAPLPAAPAHARCGCTTAPPEDGEGARGLGSSSTRVLPDDATSPTQTPTANPEVTDIQQPGAWGGHSVLRPGQHARRGMGTGSEVRGHRTHQTSSKGIALIRQVQGVWSPEPEGQSAFPQILRQHPEVLPDPTWGREPLQADVLAGGPQSAQGPHAHLVGLLERAPPPLGSGGRRHIHHLKPPGPHSWETASLPPRRQAGPARVLPRLGAKGARRAVSGLRVRGGPCPPRVILPPR